MINLKLNLEEVFITRMIELENKIIHDESGMEDIIN